MNIALSQRIIVHKGFAYDSIEHGWYRLLQGHSLAFVPNRPDQDAYLNRLADVVDFLILTGGNDNPVRRLTEVKLASKMLERKKPVLGVCHGCFLLVDLLGGQVEEIDDHLNTYHKVNYNGKQVAVNSFHSLHIKKLHSTATSIATDMEDNTEAWIDGNLAGIVWHPERMDAVFIPDEIRELIKL